MITRSHTGAEAVLILRMRPSWNVVDDLRRFVEKFCIHVCPRGALRVRKRRGRGVLRQTKMVSETRPRRMLSTLSMIAWLVI